MLIMATLSSAKVTLADDKKQKRTVKLPTIPTITTEYTQSQIPELHGIWHRLAILVTHGVQEAVGSISVTRTISKGSQMAKVSRL
jgi:hypothetical protein